MHTNSQPYRQAYWRRLWTLCVLAGCMLTGPVMATDNPPIKVGVLHALTGTMAASECASPRDHFNGS